MRLALMLFLATTPPALAQSVVHEVWGPTHSFGFSEVVESAGDVNLDGVPDYVVTNPFAYSHAAPILTIHSGDT
ncbi:MAG: integrin alpha, partial [Planctomycetota bacterium JB042]